MKTRTKVMIGIASMLLLLAALAALIFIGAIKINTPFAARYPVRGVDVSEYQGDIRWDDIERQGIQFAFIKATEGSGYTDPFFHKNWARIAETAILHGAYHFFSFDSPAKTQAENFIAAVGNERSMLPPVVDVELYGQHKVSPPDANVVRAELQRLLDELEDHYGMRPILYATWQSHSLYLSSGFSQYPLWIRSVFLPPHVTTSAKWTFWQYTDKGRLSGYDGPEKYIDINVFADDLDALRRMAIAPAGSP